MGYGRFDRRIPLQGGGTVTVRGPFDPEDHEVDEAHVLFLVIQGKGAGTAVVKGLGRWERGQNDDDWTGDVSITGKKPDGADLDLQQGIARGIALAIVVRPGKLFRDDSLPSEESQSGPNMIFDPPQVEGVTWCSDFVLV